VQHRQREHSRCCCRTLGFTIGGLTAHGYGTWVRTAHMQVSIGCTAVFLIGGPTKHTEPLPIIVLSTTPLHSTPLNTAAPLNCPISIAFFSLSVCIFRLGQCPLFCF
jgi:hypothetical protein